MTKSVFSSVRPSFDAVDAAIFAAGLLSHKGASNIVCWDMRQAGSWTDTLVVASGDYESQVVAYAQFVDQGFRRLHGVHMAISGLKFGHWVTLDSGSFVVCVFSSEARAYYDLDKHLENQAIRLDYSEPNFRKNLSNSDVHDFSGLP